MSPPPAPRRKATDAYHHGDLRAALVAAALRQIEESGAEAVSMKALAQSLGVSQPAPYRHFPDREALLVAVAVESFRAFSAALRAAAEAASASATLRAMASAYVVFGREHVHLYRLMFASRLLPSSAPESELAVVAQESFELLLEAVRVGGAAGAEARRAALGIWASLHGIVMLDAEGLLSLHMMVDVPIDRLVRDAVTPR